MHRWKLGVIFLLVISLQLNKAQAAEPDSGSSPYIFRLSISGCTHEPLVRAQTGFLVQGLPGIVTALHGLADCSVISAGPNESDHSSFPDLKIIHVDIKHDIALVSSSELTSIINGNPGDGFEAVTTSEMNAEDYDVLQIAGYPYDIDVQLQTTKVVANAIRLLDDLLPISPKKILQKRDSPSLSIRVLKVQTQLPPGESGSPVLTKDKKVIGMADGGLENGLSFIVSWAILLQEVKWTHVEEAKSDLDILASIDPGEALSFSSAYSKEPSSIISSNFDINFFKSYRFRMKLDFDGMLDQQLFKSSLEEVGLYNSRNLHQSAEIVGSMLPMVFPINGLDKLEYYAQGSKAYELYKMGVQDYCQSYDSVRGPVFASLVEVFATPFSEFKLARGILLGEEEINGQQVQHYLLDPASVSTAYDKAISVDIWITADSHRIVKAEGERSANHVELRPNMFFSGNWSMSFQFFDVGKDLSVSFPSICTSKTPEPVETPNIHTPIPLLLTPTESEKPGDSKGYIYFQNQCDSPVRLALSYKDSLGIWEYVKWWELQAEQSTILSDANNIDLVADSPYFYFYAETTDGSNQVWRGDKYLNFDGVTLPTIQKQLSQNSEGNWVLTITCQ